MHCSTHVSANFLLPQMSVASERMSVDHLQTEFLSALSESRSIDLCENGNGKQGKHRFAESFVYVRRPRLESSVKIYPGGNVVPPPGPQGLMEILGLRHNCQNSRPRKKKKE